MYNLGGAWFVWGTPGSNQDSWLRNGPFERGISEWTWRFTIASHVSLPRVIFFHMFVEFWQNIAMFFF